MWRSPFRLFALSSFLLLACTEDSGGQSCQPGNAWCACFNGNLCAAGSSCLDGTCIPEGTTGDGDGGPGDCDPACPDGSICADGECVELGNCPCPAGAYCNLMTNTCVAGCLSEADCPNGKYCDLVNKQCKPGCTVDNQCGTNEVCNVASHDCECAPNYQLCANECIPSNDVCEQTCGNGGIDGSEACDGNQLGGFDCTNLGFDDGTLSCLPDCSGFDQSDCYNYGCGNGSVDPGEACDDGNNMNGDGCSSDCSCAMEFLTIFRGHSYYTVQTMGAMTDNNVFAACQNCGLKVPCAGPNGCVYTDGLCKQTMIEDNCGFPLEDLAWFLDMTSPQSSPKLEGVYQYMGQAWENGEACGSEGNTWCSSGYSNRKSLCVDP